MRDPDRREEAEDLREALALWREDARATARAVADGPGLPDRVVALARRRARACAPAAARRWAAAALVMTAIGAGGTWAVAQRTPAASPDAPWTRIEEAVVDVLVGSPDFSPIPARKGGN